MRCNICLYLYTNSYLIPVEFLCVIQVLSFACLLTALLSPLLQTPSLTAFDAPRLARRAKVFAMTRVSIRAAHQGKHL
jgi:hypothetical protein